MNTYVTVVGVVFLCIGIPIMLVSIIASADANRTIEEYETESGVMERVESPDAQSEYESALTISGFGSIGVVFGGFTGIVGFIILTIGLAMPPRDRKDPQIDMEGGDW
jgi:hypothetical protein